MPYGSYWPNMYFDFSAGTGTEGTTDIRDFIVSNGKKKYVFNTSSTCREILSCNISAFAKRTFAPALEMIYGDDRNSALYNSMSAVITISKKAPDPEWLQSWINWYRWPAVFGNIQVDKSTVKLHLKKDVFQNLWHVPPMSYSLFFLNRHESFTVDQISDPLRTIDRILEVGDTWFGSGSTKGSSTILMAYSVYMLAVKGMNRNLFCKDVQHVNGIVSYLQGSVLLETLPTLVEFMDKYSINESVIRNAFSGSGNTLGIADAVGMYRAFTANKKSNAWA